MDLLVLGGTAFVGRETARQALERGWSVTCAARGTSGPVPDGAELVRVDRDEDDGLAALAGRRFDAALDVARAPGHVRRAVRDLDVGHWVLVSTVNVYADQATPGLEESADLLEPLGSEVLDRPEDYGAAKVACEHIVGGTASWTAVRAGLIAGPGDETGRTGWWPWHLARHADADVVLPTVPGHPAQLIDVRDLAAWMLDAAAERRGGAYDLVGEQTTLEQVLATAREVAGHTGGVVPASSEQLLDAGVRPWSGPGSLPLWMPDASAYGMIRRDGSAAEVRRRPLAETLRDVLAWEQQREVPHGAGLTDAEHADLLGRLRATASGTG